MAAPNVLITGAGRGIGRAIAHGFASQGARLVLTARTRRELEQVAREVAERGGEAQAVEMDVTDLASVETGMATALDYTGGVLDVLVNNAGVFAVKPLEEMSPATWYRILACNLNGPFHVTWLALPSLLKSSHAHIFNIASVAGQQGFAGSTAYCTSKYGLRGFSDALRLEVAEHGIRVSTVYPGATDTTIFDDVPGEWDRSTMNQPSDVADVVLRAWLSPAEEDVQDLNIPPPQ